MATPTKAKARPARAARPAAPKDDQPMLYPVAIAYDDGSTDHVANMHAPKVLIALEAEGYILPDDRDRLRTEHGGSMGQVQYQCWLSLGKPGKSYEAWASTVAGLSPLDPVPFGSARRRDG